MPTISVIVATRNRCASLARLIEAMRGVPQRPTWELIVVNNGGEDDTNVLLASSAVSLPLVVVDERHPGKSRALNRALKHAQGDLVVFTDDDVIPSSRWLDAMHEAATNFPQANVFGGRVSVDRRVVPEWILQSYNLKTILTSEQDLGDEIRWFADGEYPVGPNFAVRRRVIETGQFQWPVNLGPGTRIPVGDERGFLMQVSPPYAHDRLYVPGSVVRHDVAVSELKRVKAITRCFQGGYAAGVVNRRQPGRYAGQPRGDLPALVLHRCHESSSFTELICIVARALGVIAGTVFPVPIRFTDESCVFSS